ncbi:DUF6879 family protein [Nocardia fusca]|uniref:DUF6879 family protein n=1 Tax=Nocardia fusca TaxID=941183 RepID=A0ABV3F0X6_9NOCA
MRLLQNQPWPDLFRRAERSAFHLEVRDTYAVPDELEPFRRFLAGEPPTADNGFSESWGSLMRESTGRGVMVSRVRVVTVPLSDYQRWVLSVTDMNAEVGENIRYLPRHLADHVPQDDFWLFDDETVGFNLVDGEGKPAGAAVTTDAGIAAHCRQVKEQLWGLAVPFADFRP